MGGLVSGALVMRGSEASEEVADILNRCLRSRLASERRPLDCSSAPPSSLGGSEAIVGGSEPTGGQGSLKGMPGMPGMHTGVSARMALHEYGRVAAPKASHHCQVRQHVWYGLMLSTGVHSGLLQGDSMCPHGPGDQICCCAHMPPSRC